MSTEPGPLRYCDLVMKGGITSGVVYPPAVVELSKKFHFKNIGGTSAGAIAAAVTAAAEFGRQRNVDGFAKLAKLPKDLGESITPKGDSLLLSLFRPQKQTSPLFRILVASLGTKRCKPLKIALAAVRNFPLWAALGAIPGLLFTYLCFCGAHGVFFWISFLVGLILILLGLVIGVVIGLYQKVTHAIPENHYGLSRGFIEGPHNVPVLTPWLSGLINETAGLKADGDPLTFGNLWGPDEKEPLINLQMMTTNLTTGRPYRLPFTENTFYFDPAEWSKFFPKNVIDWLTAHSADKGEPKFAPLRQLPLAKDLPVIVATRMSLSFPVLLSAVPLYARDFGRVREEDKKPQKTWFSDGGICSNFPVHFFDAPLPRWPTFAINLKPFHPDHPKSPVFMPNGNTGGISETFTNFDQGNGPTRLFGFVGALINTVRNWNDNMQTHLPGYRDRIAHVSLDKTEGGINLNMPPKLIVKLGKRGELAAKRLIEHFTVPANKIHLSWDNQRWVRYRSMMGLLEQMLKDIEFTINNPMPGDRPYLDLIQRQLGDPPKSYQLKKSQREFAYRATLELMALAEKWRKLQAEDTNSTFTIGTPNPQPELRVRPRV